MDLGVVGEEHAHLALGRVVGFERGEDGATDRARITARSAAAAAARDLDGGQLGRPALGGTT